MLKQINKSSIFFRFLSKQDQHDLAATIGISVGRENKIFNSFLVTIMVNKTEYPFVLPISGMCEFKYDTVECICMPVLPQYAIILAKPPIPRFMIENDKIKFWEVSTEDMVHKINKYLFDYESKSNRRGVVANKRKLLEDLINNM